MSHDAAVVAAFVPADERSYDAAVVAAVDPAE